MKLYHYWILAQFPDGGKASYTYNASSERDARNKFKAHFNQAKIISCERRYEIKTRESIKSKNKETIKSKNKETKESNKLTIGIASAIGGFILSKIFSNK